MSTFVIVCSASISSCSFGNNTVRGHTNFCLGTFKTFPNTIFEVSSKGYSFA